MFYTEEEFDPTTLRFGDVLRGFINTVPNIENPFIPTQELNFTIISKIPTYSVVMTPCCSIGEQTILLAPLNPVPSHLFQNINIVDKFTILNRPIQRKLSIPPKGFAKMSPQKKKEIERERKSYTFIYYFFYDKHDIFEPFEVRISDKTYTSQFQSVDFRQMYQIRSKHIIKNNRVHQNILDTKCLELSTHTRNALRDKLTFFFGRPPKEEKALLDIRV